MKIDLLAIGLASLVVGCASSTPSEGTSEAPVNAGNAETDFVVCNQELVDHGLGVVFSKNNDDVTKAVLSETTRAETKVLSELRVCRAFPSTEPPVPDLARKTHSCNDVSFVDGYEVDLIQGGISGDPTIILKKMNAEGQLVPVDATFACHYIFE